MVEVREVETNGQEEQKYLCGTYQEPPTTEHSTATGSQVLTHMYWRRGVFNGTGRSRRGISSATCSSIAGFSDDMVVACEGKLAYAVAAADVPGQ